MKTKLNIKPVYIAAFVTIIFIAISTWINVNSNNSTKDALAAIIENANSATQEKLDGLKDGLSTLNENDKVIAGKIDALSTDLGLLKDDIVLLQENVTSLDLKVEDNQKAVLIQLEGLKTSLDDVRKQQGYASVTAKQLLSYNRCVASGRSNCSSILD
jgi:hypothetical protein